MADNYLERRMEDLRSGKLGGSKATSTAAAAPRKGWLSVRFPERRVLVTGGAHGIGLAVARAFLKAGCKVAVFDVDKEAGERLASAEGARFYHLDVADTDALERAMANLLEAWRDLDVVVSNAGIADFKPLTECSLTDFRRAQDVNLIPAFLIARALARHREGLPLPNSFGGRVILISSTRHLQSEAGTEAYSASKGALASLTHALMMSLSPYGITVNSISPGWIHTREDEPVTEADRLHHPSRRIGEPEDVARLCLFLAAPGNDFINGADISIDGGMTHKMIY